VEIGNARPTVTPHPKVCMHNRQKPLVALVEDDRSLAALIAGQLEAGGFDSQAFHRGGSILRHLESEHASVVLLDLSLPDMDGLEVLARVQALPTPPPVVVLSSLDNPIVVARALDEGAEDYVRKPFDGGELCARLRAVLRRTAPARDQRLTRNADLGTDCFRFGPTQVFPDRLEIAFSNGQRQRIGRKEIGILLHLQANPGVIVSRHALIHAVWGAHANIRSRSLDQYVVKIRDLFGRNGEALDCFRTIHGIGYWYEPRVGD
jgi:DNA-binding response OmpR family regulator